MRKWMTGLAGLCMLALWAGASLAAGVTLHVLTPFADMDFAAQGYMDMITAWESETGNVVEDYSGLPDEALMAQLGELIESGAADVVVLPVGSGLTVGELVSAGELEQAMEGGVRRFSSMKEEDGSILLTPVRMYWEALYVNTDVLEKYGIAVPRTFEQLLAACALLSQNGVTPIANALCDWSEIVLNCAALAGADAAQYGQEASLEGAKNVLEMLVQVGAFGGDPWNVSDADMEQAFLSGEAAMRFDADSLAYMVDESRLDQTVVTAVPVMHGTTGDVIVGVPTFGAAITRSCWQDDARFEAALSLLGRMLSGDGFRALCAPVGGELGRSIAQMTADAKDCSGILYDMNPDGFDAWAEKTVASLMGR
ncbi:MAG: extracellular solute-binding protein [Clostridia bacterium]|nr:extracellular solute-binding protein [Clostridia bacterium]